MPHRNGTLLPNFARRSEKAQDDVKKNLADTINERNLSKQIADGATEIKGLEERKCRAGSCQLRYLIEQRKDEPGSFEVADGRISWVNQNGTVWINLGIGRFAAAASDV